MFALYASPRTRTAEPLSGFPSSFRRLHATLLDHVPRHARVDLARELDEARPLAVLGRLPGEVEGIERDAVAAEARARVERHEAERLGLGRLDDLPDVDPHAVEDHLQLVHERDVHGAEDVLEELRGLGDARARDRDDACRARRRTAPRPTSVEAAVHAADDLRDRLRGEVRAARVLALGREGEQEVLRACERPALSRIGRHLLVGRARVGRRLEHDELARAGAAPRSAARSRG